MTTTTDFLVMTDVQPYGDVREPGWSLFGERSKCSLHHKHRYWHGATQESLAAMMPISYITRSVYEKLKKLGEIEGIIERIKGVVEDDWRVEVPNPYYGGGTCWALDLDKVIPGLPERSPPITCENRGCTLLDYFDADNDGKISSDEAATARASIGKNTPAGVITEDVINFINKAMEAGSIDVICPGCYGVVSATINDWTLPMHAKRGSTITPVVTVTNKLGTQSSVRVHVSGVERTTGYPMSSARMYVVIPPYGTMDVKCPIVLAATAAKGTYWLVSSIYPLSDLPDVPVTAFGSIKKIVIDDSDTYVPPRVCTEGEKRSPETCWDGSVIHKEICRDNKWVSTGETCPTRVCTEGAKRSPETCWDGSVIHKEVCRDNKWVSTGETCPTRPPAPECKEGDKKAGYVCSGGKWVPVSTPPVTCTEGTYNAEGTMICRGGTWVPVSAPPPECTEGTYNAAGTMICSGGTWVPVSAPPGPGVTPKYLTVSEADERVRMGLPCYIKCTLPVLNMLPGIPYTPGAWIPPFCVITTEQ